MKNKANEKEIEGFRKVVTEMVSLKERKAADYQSTWRAFGIQGMYAQLGRKFSRIWLNKDKPAEALNNEMMRDSLLDNAVYSLMAIQMLDEGAGGGEDLVLKALMGEI